MLQSLFSTRFLIVEDWAVGNLSIHRGPDLIGAKENLYVISKGSLYAIGDPDCLIYIYLLRSIDLFDSFDLGTNLSDCDQMV